MRTNYWSVVIVQLEIGFQGKLVNDKSDGSNAMKPIRTYILIADGGRARILLSEGRNKPLTEVTGSDLRHDAKPDQDLSSDRPGRVHEFGERFAPRHRARRPAPQGEGAFRAGACGGFGEEVLQQRIRSACDRGRARDAWRHSLRAERQGARRHSGGSGERSDEDSKPASQATSWR